ncbi:MAG TPA: 4Fe-4S binding protein [Candidatus Goldiibacteriota bacterium]|nr:4Fe-4S binding protein [Candidatus Goldiibacteriota bacterium]
MLRDMITIDEEKCNGCGVCVPGCPEGALQVIDGKVRLVSDLLCDGLGACIKECPEGALKVEKKEAMPYDEEKVMVNIVKAGVNTLKAHLKHLEVHGETKYLDQALIYLKKNGIEIPDYKEEKMTHGHMGGGCPGARTIDFSGDNNRNSNDNAGISQQSELRQWPVQMHLISPNAPYFQGKDLLFAADCVAFSMGNFHRDYLKGKSLAIACPKLDSEQDIYREKIRALIDEAKVNTITVMMMQVPCCGGLLGLTKAAAAEAKRKVPVKAIVVGLKGEVLSEEWA